MGSKQPQVVQAAPVAAAPSVGETAESVYQAQLKYNPLQQQQSFQMYADPNYGAQAYTQMNEDIRSSVFSGENDVRNALQQNVLQSLLSPTGLSPEQQSAIDARRGLATGQLQESMRNRANLGGNLYGGRSAAAEARDVGNLQNQFAEEDISREERSRNNAIQSALPFLQILFPDVGISSPQFESAVPSGSTAYQGGLQQRSQDIGQSQYNAGLQQQSYNNQAQLRSSLYGALGGAVGGIGGGIGGGIAASCWVASEIFGGWMQPKTVLARKFVANQAPAWFRDFYMKNGEQIARFIRNKPVLKAMLRPLFELFALSGRRQLCQ